MNEIKKIAIIGNIAGGKTKLSQQLSKIYAIPVTHIDSVQFLPGMIIRPHSETKEIINTITSHEEKWIIDGFGPLDILEKRLQLADHIVFVDLPLWRHYLWCLKRQIKNLWKPRAELPSGCNELTIVHTRKLFKTIWQIHSKMRPEMTRILLRDNLKNKVTFIRTLEKLNSVHKNGL
ncbi:MAG: flagellar protein FlaR [Bdellovibrio sp.]